MRVIGHQRLGVQLRQLAQQCFTLLAEVALVVLYAEEAGFTVVASLQDMQRQTIKVDAWTTGLSA